MFSSGRHRRANIRLKLENAKRPTDNRQLVKKPAILIPSPNVAEDHQTKNAMALVNSNAAVLIKDSEAKDKLCSTAIELINNESQCKMLGDNIAKLAFKESAAVIANEILKLVEQK